MKMIAQSLAAAVVPVVLAVTSATAQIETVAPRGLPAIRNHSRTTAARDLAADSSRAPGTAVQPVDDTPNLKGIDISAEFLVRAEDFQAGNVIAPSASGHYEERLFGGTGKVRGQWYVNLAIQAPSTADDSAAYLNRLLASGGTGNLSVGMKGGVYAQQNRRGAIATLQGRVSWTNHQQLDHGAIPSLGFGTLRLSGSAWAGPIIGAVEISENHLFSDPARNVAAEPDSASKDAFRSDFEGPLSIVVSASVKFTLLGVGNNAPQFLTARYLVPTSDVRATNNLEIRFTQTLDLFR